MEFTIHGAAGSRSQVLVAFYATEGGSTLAKPEAAPAVFFFNRL
jgi:hypothetical protein